MPYERELQWSYNWVYRRLQYWSRAAARLGRALKDGPMPSREILNFCNSLNRDIPAMRRELKVLDAMTPGSCFRSSRALLKEAQEPLEYLAASVEGGKRQSQLALVDEVYVALRDALEKVKDDADLCYKPIRLMPMVAMARPFPQEAWERLQRDAPDTLAMGPYLL